MRIDLLIFPHIDRIAKLTKRRSLMEALKWAAWGGLLVAMASPYSIRRYEPFVRSDRDTVAVFDVRGPGGEGIKSQLQSFVEGRRGDRVGLVAAGSRDLILVPLTRERFWIEKILGSLHRVHTIRFSTYDLLAQAVRLLGSAGAGRKVAILVTRGERDTGEIPPSVVKKMAAFHHVILYGVVVGNDGAQSAGLKKLARSSGGDFFVIRRSEDWQAVWKEIASREPSPEIERTYITKIYHYDYPLFVAAMALLGFMFMTNRSEVK